MRFTSCAVLATAVFAACGGSTPAVTVPAPPVVVTAPVPVIEPAPAPRPLAIAQPPLLDKPLPGDTAAVTIHRLSNGITVYLSPDPNAATIVARIVVHAGSSNDPEQSTGLAHYLEHMLFKGSEQLGTLDYAKEKPHLDRIAQLYGELRGEDGDRDRDRILAAIDAETVASTDTLVANELESLFDRMGFTGHNAYTNSDETAYVCEIPRNRLVQWARVQADRFAHPVFRMFWTELEAVYEEKNRSLDNPSWRIDDAINRALFPRHGYGWSDTLGEVEHLKKPAYADMVAFFERYYTPRNMAIVLSGGIDDATLPTLERELGTLSRPAGDARPGEPVSGVHGRTQLDVPVPSAPGVVMAWPLPAANDPDAIVLGVMDQLASDGAAGIIYRDLRLPQRVAAAGSFPDFRREAGQWRLWADQLAGQDADAVEALLRGVVAKLKAGDFTDDDLHGAILGNDIGRLQELETRYGREGLMETSFIHDQPWTDVVAETARVRAVTRADVVRVANKYLTDDVVVARKVVQPVSPPHIAKPRITPFKVDPSRHSAFADAILALPVTPIDPVAVVEGKDFTRGKLKTGELISVENHRDDLFALSYSYDYARTDDKLACFAFDVLSRAGAGTRSAAELTRALYALGVEISFDCGLDRASIVLRGVDGNLEPALALLRDWIGKPQIDAELVRKSVDTAKTWRANQLGDPATIAQAVSAYANYGDRSTWRDVPSNRELEGATPARIVALVGRYQHLAHHTAYFGPRTAAAAATAVTFGDGTVATAPRKPFRYRPPQVTAADQDNAQTTINLIWPRPPATEDERAIGLVYFYYESALLYREVREVRGLAYSVGGGWRAAARSSDDAAMWAYIATQGDKTDDAIAAILETMHQPIDEHRFAEARTRIAEAHRAYRVEPRDVAATVRSWEDNGVTTDPSDDRVRRALAVDQATVQAWAARLLAGKPLVSVVGARGKLDEAKLAALGKVVWIQPAQAFGY